MTVVEELYKKSVERHKNYKTIFLDHRAGQQVLEDLKARYFIHTSTKANSKVTDMVDPHQTLINEGCRNVVLYILACLEEPVKPPEGDPVDKGVAW